MVFIPPPMPCQVSHCARVCDVKVPAERTVAMAAALSDERSGRGFGQVPHSNASERRTANRAINDAMCRVMASSLSVMDWRCEWFVSRRRETRGNAERQRLAMASDDPGQDRRRFERFFGEFSRVFQFP